MVGLYVAFSFLIIAMLGAAAYWSLRVYRVYKTNILVSEELDKIITSTLKTIKKNKGATGGGIVYDADGVPDILGSPDLLSTLITVLINKLGTTRLSMQDFMISEDEYVSIYVDTDTQEIVLSLNHNLEPGDMYVGFGDPTDSTFH